MKYQADEQRRRRPPQPWPRAWPQATDRGPGTRIAAARAAAACTLLLTTALGFGWGCGRSPLASTDTDEEAETATPAERGEPECGDGRIDSDETCDGPALGGADCEQLGFEGGELSCAWDCRYDTRACTEWSAAACERRALSASPLSAGCASELCACAPAAVRACDAPCMDTIRCIMDRCNGLESGPGCILSHCTPEMNPELSAVTDLLPCLETDTCGLQPFDWSWLLCGNGRREGLETCDGQDFGQITCEDYGLSGTLYCNSSCQIDPRSCKAGQDGQSESRCGDGVRSPLEACEGDDFGGLTCASFGRSGALRCSPFCSIDVSTCGPGDTCGDGVVGPTEQCDGSLFLGGSCTDFGLEGELRCNDRCELDVSGCTGVRACGNQVREPMEDCDGADTGGLSCRDYGLSGTLRCTPWCTLDLSECDDTAQCGDGVRTGTEACDDDDLGATTCRRLGFARGQLSCNEDCTLEVTDCTRCGDGRLDPDEACEPGGAIRSSCSDFNLGDGDLGCDPERCQLDTSECSEARQEVCGDGVVDEGEACEGELQAPCTDLGLVGGMAPCNPDTCIWDRDACAPAPRSRAECDLCIETHCQDMLAACRDDTDCRNGLTCVQEQCARGSLSGCAARCDLGVDGARNAREALACFLENCGPQCMGQAPNAG